MPLVASSFLKSRRYSSSSSSLVRDRARARVEGKA